MYFCMKAAKNSTGIIMSVAEAASSPQATPLAEIYPEIPTGRVCERGVALRVSANMNSFHDCTNAKIPVAKMPGKERGTTILINILGRLAPSIYAASSNSTGMLTKKLRNIQREKGRFKVVCISMIVNREFNIPRRSIKRYSGITSATAGSILAARIASDTTSRTFDRTLLREYPAGMEMNSDISVDSTPIMRLFL
jgi:hypothetical protein